MHRLGGAVLFLLWAAILMTGCCNSAVDTYERLPPGATFVPQEDRQGLFSHNQLGWRAEHSWEVWPSGGHTTAAGLMDSDGRVVARQLTEISNRHMGLMSHARFRRVLEVQVPREFLLEMTDDERRQTQRPAVESDLVELVEFFERIMPQRWHATLDARDRIEEVRTLGLEQLLEQLPVAAAENRRQALRKRSKEGSTEADGGEPATVDEAAVEDQAQQWVAKMGLRPGSAGQYLVLMENIMLLLPRAAGTDWETELAMVFAGAAVMPPAKVVEDHPEAFAGVTQDGFRWRGRSSWGEKIEVANLGQIGRASCRVRV